MPCTNPKKAWKYGLHPSGKTKLVFSQPKETGCEVQRIPCGKCISCKLDYSREWATRITHEAQTAGISCFITLTIDDDHMQKVSFSRIKDKKEYPGYSVYKRSVQLFIKRMRKQTKAKFKYFACGEYGDLRQRPHYHICILGYDFPDKIYWKKTESGSNIYRSKELEKLWEFGFAHIGEVNFQTAGYTARYTLKKSKNKEEYVHVDGYNEETGEITKMYGLNPEFIIMSKGIGLDWWNKYKTDTDKDYLSIDYDKKVKVPRYYDKQREKVDPESLEQIKQKREEEAKTREIQDNAKRRYAKNIVKTTQSKMLKRSLDNE